MDAFLQELKASLRDTYRVERELGGGAMSRVFVADDLALSRKVVLKVLSAELAGVVNAERFNRETQLLARLQHPHIVPVLTVGSVRGLPWFSMPYIEGESLRMRITRDGALPVGEVVSLMRDIAKAIAYAHERGVVHRDIKPDNILLTGDSVSVADFGIAKALNEARNEAPGPALTQVGMVVGTPGYMSPEQVTGSGKIDHRADIYALGCVAYEMLCGAAPFAGKSTEQQLRAHLVEPPVPISERREGVPSALASLVMRCLAKDPDDRPQEAREIVAALEQADVRSGERSGTVVVRSRAARWRTVVLAVAATVVLLAGYLLLRPDASLQAQGALEARARLVMTDFMVRGGDALLGRVASDAVRAGLVQSDAVRLLTPAEIGDALRRMERPQESPLSLELMRELALRDSAQAIVDGELTVVGASYVLAVRLVTADSARELASVRASATGADSLIHLADQVSRELRARIGESLKTVNASPPLARVTTASLEALRRYSAGVHAADVEGKALRAAELFREAVTIDTLFAEGWRRLGATLSRMGSAPVAADSALSRAYQLRDRLSELERERVTASYFTDGTRADRVKAIRAYERVLALGDSTAMRSLARLYESRREYGRAEALRRMVVARDSGLLRLSELRRNFELQGRWTAVDSIEAIAQRRFPTDEMLAVWALTRASRRGDLAAYRRLHDSVVAIGDTRDPVQTANRQLMLALQEGRLRDADRFRAVSLDTYRAQGAPIDEIDYAFVSVEQSIETGAESSARLRKFEDALRAAAPDKRLEWMMPSARMYAKAGLVAKAKAALAEFDRLKTDPAERLGWASTRNHVELELAIAEGRWAQAAAMVRKDDQQPDGPANSCDYCATLELVRVFAAGGQADSALAQYEAYRRTITGRRPRIGPDLSVPMRTLWALARIYDARGDRANALTAYRDYALRYERADPELQGNVRDAKERVRALGAEQR